MPTILREGSFRFFFYSNEGDPREPAHIHVRAERGEAKFWLSPVVLAYNQGFDAQVLAKLTRLVEQRRDKFERAWNDHFSVT